MIKFDDDIFLTENKIYKNFELYEELLREIKFINRKAKQKS